VKGVLCDVPQSLLDERRRTGADRWDEMWDGVLHMTPSPSREHQDFQDELRSWIRTHWARPFGNRVHRELNLCLPGGWPNDFRIPDLLLLDPPRFHIDKDTYFDGAPLVVIEIHSPGDETYEKFDFYAELGVPEVWIIHRDTRKPQLFALKDAGYDPVPANEEGWLISLATDIRMKARRPKKLLIQYADDDTTAELLPETP
jgi:Uma2 family endonuclease